ncbi:MAG: purine nucleoside transporter PunC [Psychromonas sp.]
MKQQPSKLTLVWFACLSMLGFLATDMYLPAFNLIQDEFATTQHYIGLSLSIFLLGMALGQLIYGPLSDRLGRIKVLVAGMLLFSVASLFAASATSVETFLVARFFQALGACSAAVIWQAVVIDRYAGKESERIFATIMPLVALSPALAPIIGASLEGFFGWRSIFIALVIFGGVLAVMTLKQSESVDKNKKHEKLSTQLRKDYKQILSSKKFIGNMLIFSAASAAFFAYLTGSPFVMNAMGYTPTDIALSFVPQTISFIIGGYGCRALLNHFDSKKILAWAVGLFFVTVTVIFTISINTTPTTIWPILLPFCFIAIANGAIYPVVINQALSEFKNCSATAAGLLNFLQTILCFAASGIVSAFTAFGLITISTAMLISGMLLLFGFFLVSKSNRIELQTATAV